MIEPQRRRLTVGPGDIDSIQGAAAEAAAGRREEAAADILREFGLDQIFERAAQDGKRAGLLLSNTDTLRDKKKSFDDKDMESYCNSLFESREAFNAWVDETKIAFKCHKGKKPESPNQDSFSIVIIEGDFALYCIFDGHGPFGHDVSNLARSQVIYEFLSRRGYGPTPAEFSPATALSEAFVSTQRLLEQRLKSSQPPDSKMSGTTCTVAYHDILNGTLHLAHVGDSRSIISDFGKVRELTVDHKPDKPEERKRIEQNGGRVVFDGYYNHRVFSQKGMYPGLNMSRALGDVIGHEEAGLTAEPDVLEIKLSDSPELLLLCTDGVWEFIGNEEVMNMATRGCGKKLTDISPQDLKRNLLDITKASYAKWMKDSDDEISDDITGIAVVVSSR